MYESYNSSRAVHFDHVACVGTFAFAGVLVWGDERESAQLCKRAMTLPVAVHPRHYELWAARASVGSAISCNAGSSLAQFQLEFLYLPTRQPMRKRGVLYEALPASAQ